MEEDVMETGVSAASDADGVEDKVGRKKAPFLYV